MRSSLAFPWLASLLALVACGDADRPAGRSGLLITLDTTRADALGCYGASGTRTPHLDRIAAEGVLFERAYTTVPLTLPAHVSMLTGLYPPRHGLRDNGVSALPDEALTLAEVAREAGHQTGGILASVVLSEKFGTDQGFETFTTPSHFAGADANRPEHGSERRAGEIVDEALRWLEDRDRERPFFLWLHFYDPHHPYQPPPDFDPGTLSQRPYLAEVAYMDGELGRLFDALRDADELDRTAVLVVGDHGESFGEHGEFTHGVLCFEPTLRVPFLVRAPDVAPARSGDVVSVVDVLPTLAACMGLPLPRNIDGRNALAPGDPDRGVYYESYYGYFSYGWSPLVGWIDAQGKYMHTAEPLLLDPLLDPDERRDFSGERADRIEAYRRRIAELWDEDALEVEPEQFDEELLESIRALGYVGGGSAGVEIPHPFAESDRPSPVARSGFFAQQARAQEFLMRGEVDEAAEVYAGVLDEDPGNTTAMDELARLRIRQNRLEDAATLFQRVVDLAAPRARNEFNLGTALLGLGKVEEAVGPLLRAVELSRGRPRYLQKLDQVLRSLGRQAEAREIRRRFEEG